MREFKRYMDPVSRIMIDEVGDTLDEVLKVYDSDDTTKSIVFGGYEENKQGKWLRKTEGGCSVYYFRELTD